LKRFAGRRGLLVCGWLGLIAANAGAQAWRPPAGTTEIALWPANVPIARPQVKGPERAEVYRGPKAPLGIPTTTIFDVTRPTLTIFPAKGANAGAAVLVFPGGGYQVLAIDFEGTEVCDWLTPLGITCGVLKYRVPWSGPHWDDSCKCQSVPPVPMALQDGQRAMAILRQRAREFGIDPHKIGVLGFSAGGHLVADTSNAEKLSYAPVDSADNENTRPDFGVALYPGHLWSGEALDLEPFDHISAKAPPTFIVAAEDDPVDDVRNSIAYFLALRDAKIPVEMHIYAHGGHAFGLRRTDQPITHWPDLVEKWLRTIGILKTAHQ
jgi:acetyl esterase/lipase